MNYFVKIYRRYIYGVMGTLLFHIFLIAAFLFAEVDMKGNIKEEPLVIEFPDILPEEDKIPEEIKQENLDSKNETANNLTNTASNKLSVKNNVTSKDKFFDEDYLKEVNAAKNLVSDVNNQLAKEKVKIEDIKMPVESTEGMDPDSIKNIVYTGESNIIYYLENRYHVSLPIPVYLAQGGGRIVIEINVDRQGKVVDANLATGQKIRDQQIVMYAQTAASKTLFNADPKAPALQKGTIHYNFIAQ
ncbi:MAG: hypothetical protein IPF54_09770 [Draconibacterium sp.]|nr:hypothetical protein [Draconibacterium sp.]